MSCIKYRYTVVRAVIRKTRVILIDIIILCRDFIASEKQYVRTRVCNMNSRKRYTCFYFGEIDIFLLRVPTHTRVLYGRRSGDLNGNLCTLDSYILRDRTDYVTLYTCKRLNGGEVNK